SQRSRTRKTGRRSMSSTEEAAAALDVFFADEIAPCRATLIGSGISLPFPGPDPSVLTYYSRRRDPSLAEGSFRLAPEDPTSVIQCLSSIWSEEEASVLTELVAKILDLGPLFRDEELEADVSPLIYVM